MRARRFAGFPQPAPALEAEKLQPHLDFLLERHGRLLREMAWRGLQRGGRPERGLVVCIEVDVHRWLVDWLMPGQDWEVLRARQDGPPLAVGWVEDIRFVLRTGWPGLAAALRRHPPRGKVHAVVLMKELESVLEVLPEAPRS